MATPSSWRTNLRWIKSIIHLNTERRVCEIFERCAFAPDLAQIFERRSRLQKARTWKGCSEKRDMIGSYPCQGITPLFLNLIIL